MAAWKYKLKSGIALRDAIHNDDLNKVLDEILNCWKELLDQDYIDDIDYDNTIVDIENIRDSLLNYEEYELHMSDVESEIDYELDNLYDFCDDEEIWIEI